LPEDSSDFGETLSQDQQSLIASVYNSYKDTRGIQLSSITHEPGTPWSITWDKRGKNATIPTSLIEEHYKEIIKLRIKGHK
jgi:uncharacterized phage-associated protein